MKRYISFALSALVLAGTLVAPAGAQQAKNNDFRLAMSATFQRMIQSYHQGERSPLSGDILDSSRPNVAQFFGRRTDASVEHGPHSPDQSIALHYYRDAVLDGKRTAACLMTFDTSNPAFLAGYESTGLFTKGEITYYLAAHEFGHCAALHQASLGNMLSIKPGKDQELFADQYALAFFLLQDKINTAKKIIIFNRQNVAKDDFHHHPDELQAFFDAFPPLDDSLRANVKNTYDLVALTINVAAKAQIHLLAKAQQVAND
ncbi:hypothetical protein PuT2_12010 [Pusillimonas sp. T2]|uniref:hypothetical protein n=1 Tax=Pusillimonas sp. T2 TaxID=1548123 RepID=UPI000B9D36D1|nr:hypothetical protein [Pusillimonas sp. T2]OXR48685.1 hypothetical protein PuT2_12010 [Pusillimonas sp. T2]